MKTTRNNLLTMIPKILMGILFITQLQAYSNGPPNAKTGAPGEGTCRDCHSSFALNSGSGSVEILNVPESYLPGEVYTLAVRVSQSGQTRWGFELAAKTTGGSQGGTITVTQGTFTQTGSSGGITYLKQRSSGTFNGQPTQADWEFDWTAPVAGTGDITFYAAGNAANGNFNTAGDYIYTTSFMAAEGSSCIANGDANGDENLNVLDIVLVVGYIVGNNDFTDDQFCAADVNEDLNLDVLDIVSIVGMIIG